MATSMSEKFVANFFTIAIARFAMIITPFILTAIGWLAVEGWSEFRAEVADLKASDSRQDALLQDHELRLKFAAEKADQYAGQIERRFNDLTGSLKDVSSQIGTINGSIIRLQTTIENRLPPRSAKLQPDADEKAELPQ